MRRSTFPLFMHIVKLSCCVIALPLLQEEQDATLSMSRQVIRCSCADTDWLTRL